MYCGNSLIIKSAARWAALFVCCQGCGEPAPCGDFEDCGAPVPNCLVICREIRHGGGLRPNFFLFLVFFRPVYGSMPKGLLFAQEF